MTRAKQKPSIPTRDPQRPSSHSSAAPSPTRSTGKSSLRRSVSASPAAAAKAAPLPAKAKAKVKAKGKTPAQPPLAAKVQEKAKNAPARASLKQSAALKPLPPAPLPSQRRNAKLATEALEAKSAPLVQDKAPAAKSAAPSKAKRLEPPPKAVDTKATLRPIEQAVGVSSDAVLRRTGKSWAQWFALLDAAGAATLDHKGIVAVLAQRHGVGPWWQQMVTVAYEQARGKNGKQNQDESYHVDVVKTLELPLSKLFRFWAEPSERNKWLADDRFSIHKATASKSIRARWGRGSSRIDVDFCEKGPHRSQVTVQHHRIETSDAAEQMKAYWAKKINALEALLAPPSAH